jgi:hypothetical protein
MIYLKSFNPKGDPAYKLTWTDRAIMLRSDLTHTEILFSERYGGISFSATMADGCKCARFKMISYSHPLRWLTVDIACTDEQEDMIFDECCRMADLSKEWCDIHINNFTDTVDLGEIVCGPNALKYDLLGLLSFCTRWTIIRPHEKWVWCTEACFRALGGVFPSEMFPPDTLHPRSGHDLAEICFNL